MLKFAVPCILSLLVSSLYNIVDQIFIGWGVGYLGNGATNVVFPITVIALAVALMIGDGCAAFLSICQGKHDTESAHRSVGNAITLLLICSVVLVVLFVLLRDVILAAFGATENNLPYAIDYFNIIIIGIPFYIVTNGLNSIIRADGSPKFAMLSTLVGCILNVILDPIAIFVLQWGVSGAALATIAGQIVSTILGVGYLFHARSFHLHKESFLPQGGLLGKILPLGISSLLPQLSIVIIMGVMNTTLVKYGALSEYGADIPMTVVGIVMKVFQIVIAFVVGIAAGCQPIVGYNYGAGKPERVKKTFFLILAFSFGFTTIASWLILLFPKTFIMPFTDSQQLIEITIPAIRIYFGGMMFIGVLYACQRTFMALGRTKLSLLGAMMRKLVILLPLCFILPRLGYGTDGLLYAECIADVLGSAIVFAIFIWNFKSMLNPS